ncbi:MAG TPA: BrxA/BrxB family bacilliredoxin [Longimicrobiales bacterium]|nr:BrxA/BrxB family bacilliredoxin [Longimicrobiales bacterium]
MHRYPEIMIAPMRAEITDLGAEELRAPEEVDAFVAGEGTAALVVNSVCGCAAGSMRPGLRSALDRVRPDRVGTVFAGADVEATERAREIFAPYPPSSPFIGFFRDGRMTGALQRSDIQGKQPEEIAEAIVAALTDARVGEAEAGESGAGQAERGSARSTGAAHDGSGE